MNEPQTVLNTGIESTQIEENKKFLAELETEVATITERSKAQQKDERDQLTGPVHIIMTNTKEIYTQLETNFDQISTMLDEVIESQKKINEALKKCVENGQSLLETSKSLYGN